eukprot:4562635-Prymnesium_polylepis.1
MGAGSGCGARGGREDHMVRACRARAACASLGRGGGTPLLSCRQRGRLAGRGAWPSLVVGGGEAPRGLLGGHLATPISEERERGTGAVEAQLEAPCVAPHPYLN